MILQWKPIIYTYEPAIFLKKTLQQMAVLVPFKETKSVTMNNCRKKKLAF